MKNSILIVILFFANLLLAQTTVNEQVVASADDATQANPAMATLTNANAPLRLFSSGQIWGGARFITVAIPNAATIVSASITINDTLGTKVLDATIYGEAGDNAGTFTSADNNISGRTRTSASVEWDVASTATGENTSGNIATIIQEIVNRAGWANNNALVIIMSLNANNTCVSRAWDGNSAKACKLAVTYSTGGRRLQKVIFF